MKISDVIKVNIEGTITSCIILGDLIIGSSYFYPSTNNFNYLSLNLDPSDPSGHTILNDRVPLRDYYKTLVGDLIVYVETRDILNEDDH